MFICSVDKGCTHFWGHTLPCSCSVKYKWWSNVNNSALCVLSGTLQSLRTKWQRDIWTVLFWVQCNETWNNVWKKIWKYILRKKLQYGNLFTVWDRSNMLWYAHQLPSEWWVLWHRIMIWGIDSWHTAVDKELFGWISEGDEYKWVFSVEFVPLNILIRHLLSTAKTHST